MKNTFFILAFLLIMKGQLSFCQSPDSTKKVTFGFGINFEQLGLNQEFDVYNTNINKLQLNATFSSRFRFEMEGAFKLNVSENVLKAFGIKLVGLTNYKKYSFYRGVGFETQFTKWQSSEYVANNTSSSSYSSVKITSDHEALNKKLSAFIGGEYFPVDRFSLGAEIGVNYIHTYGNLQKLKSFQSTYYTSKLVS